jgi:hypothetical protein
MALPQKEKTKFFNFEKKFLRMCSAAKKVSQNRVLKIEGHFENLDYD